MRQWFQKGTAAVLAVSMLIGSAVSASAATVSKTQEEDLKIACISDTHYLSPDLIKDTADFTEHLNSDRKMFAESDAFLTALLDTIKQDDPDVLLISGDLTKDGEKEGHEDLAEKLEEFRKEEMPDLHIYIAPGNHDLNNSNGMNFNTADGAAVPAGRTSQQDYKNIYADLTYNDETVIATFTPAQGNQGGGLSYAARPKDGFTVLSIDSARYSADNTDSGMEEHETSGTISADLENWVLEQIVAAKKRGDTVIGLQHHGYIPHFSMEPDLLPMYLVNDYDRLSREFADAGMQYVFTGHMHANDIASITTENGNTLYDIETGSVVTYPSPSRSVTITRTIENGTVKENMDVKTYLGVGPITFINPATGAEQTIEDITAYGQAHGFSNDMLTTTVNGFLHGYYNQIVQAGGIKKVVEQLVNDLLGDSLPIKDITIEKLIDVGLPLLLPDGSNGEEIYYSADEGGIVVTKKVSIANLRIVVPNKALKQTLNVLFDKVDNEVLSNPEILDELVGNLVSDLTAIPAAKDGETDKTLLELANYIYQSHLGGQDNGDQPAWVKEAIANIEDGSLLESVIGVVFENLTGVLDQALDGIPFEDILGSKIYNNNTKSLVPLEEGRTPLIRVLDAQGETTLGLLFGFILKWPGADGGFVMPEGYSTKDALDALLPLLKIDLNSLLRDLILGTPADVEAGTEATEGILTEELKGQLNEYLLGVVKSMGTDDNYPQDNNTTITYEWKLQTNRTALDEAIAKAEKLDLSKYTEETAGAVSTALVSAKGLSLTATQGEMDAAAKALDDAVAGLKEIVVVDRSSLNKAIADAEKIDLTKYTDETAQAVVAALNAAKNLPETATQEEMDAAAKALNDAVGALKTISSGEDNQPGEDTNEPGEGNNKPGDDTNKPGEDSNKPGEDSNKPGENVGKPDGSTNAPQTGDTSNIVLWIALMVVSCCGVIGTTVYSKKKRGIQ